MTAINWSEVGNLTGVLQSANTSTGGSFWIGILFLVFIVLLMVLLAWGLLPALLSASFVGLVLGILMTYAQLISWTYNLIFLGILLFTFMYVGYLQR